jgi:hypothetical protein
MGAGAVALGPIGALIGATAKKSSTIDKRELYLLVDGGEWASMAKLNPDHGAKARQFAQAVNVAARKVDTVTRDRTQRVEQFERELSRIRADHREIEAATANVARLEHSAPAPVAALMIKTSGDDSVAATARDEAFHLLARRRVRHRRCRAAGGAGGRSHQRLSPAALLSERPRDLPMAWNAVREAVRRRA